MYQSFEEKRIGILLLLCSVSLHFQASSDFRLHPSPSFANCLNNMAR